MHIDCQTCPVRERMCGDCMVAHLFTLEPPRRLPAEAPTLDRSERAALDMFVTLGLVDRVDLDDVRIDVDDRPLRSVG